ncbi:MAG: D-alanyl-D-alanine carboxypeptidase [Oscillospiraceae bacterium]|nr:D-alanyl-D-alanine carboxypeptidase [Oscillospiraceae bacterium]
MKTVFANLLMICLSFCVILCMFFRAVPQWHVSAEDLTTSAKACVLIEAATGKILFEQNAQEKLPMASTTKIMTTLLTIESGDLDIEFPVDNQAIHVEGSSMGLQENDVVTKRALCYGMLLPSGNDAANASAVAVAGSIPEFAELMNKRAKEIGMTRTCFVTPSGLEGIGHGSSAWDMALLTREALQNELFREICSKAQATVKFGNPPYERTLYNSNKLLRMYDGVIGVKTGFTDEAGRCLVSACERDGVTLICVTLNDRDDWNDHMKLYDYGFSQIQPTELEVPEMTQIVVGSSRNTIPLRIQDSVMIGTIGGDLSEITTEILLAPFAYAPIADGEILGELEYYYQDRKICSVPLLADGSADVTALPEQNWIEKFFTGFRNFLKSA